MTDKRMLNPMKRQEPRLCSTCCYRVRDRCRRYAPRPVVLGEVGGWSVDGALEAVWPIVRDEDVCGEYQREARS